MLMLDVFDIVASDDSEGVLGDTDTVMVLDCVCSAELDLVIVVSMDDEFVRVAVLFHSAALGRHTRAARTTIQNVNEYFIVDA